MCNATPTRRKYCLKSTATSLRDPFGAQYNQRCTPLGKMIVLHCLSPRAASQLHNGASAVCRQRLYIVYSGAQTYSAMRQVAMSRSFVAASPLTPRPGSGDVLNGTDVPGPYSDGRTGTRQYTGSISYYGHRHNVRALQLQSCP